MRPFSNLFLKKWNSTIRTKFVMLITVVIGIFSIFILLFFPPWLENQAIRAIAEKAETITKMTAFSISPVLFFDDIEDAEEVFKGVKQNRDLVYIVVLNESGHVYAAFNKAKAIRVNFSQAKDNNRISQDGRIYQAMTPVLHNGREIGQLYLGLSLKELRAEVARSRVTIAFVSSIIFVIGIIAVFAISTAVTMPLSQMVTTVEQIAKGDLTQRAVVSAQDEVGHLAKSFNTMVKHLESAYNELENANRNLERRVEQRTEELQQEINERVRTEEELQFSNTILKTQMEASIDGILVVNDKRQWILSNQRFIDLWGFPPDVVAAKSLERAVQSVYSRLVEPDKVIAKIEYLAQHRNEVDFEQLALVDGRIFERYSAPMLGPNNKYYGRVWSYRDITERVRAEERVRQSQQRYEALVNSIDGVMWESDPQTFQFSFVSKQAEKILGYPVERWLKEPTFWSDHLHPDDKKWVSSFCAQETAEKRDHEFEYRMIAADGRIVWLRDLVSVIVDNEQVVKLRGVMVDITKRKRAEEELREREKTERLLRKRLTVLIQVSNQLSKVDSFDELCRRAVELGRSRLSFDRLGIWLFDEKKSLMMGSFGTDEKGQLRDERGQQLPLNFIAEEMLEFQGESTFQKDGELQDDSGNLVGNGTQVEAAIWDGEKVIGAISMDNLLKREPITERDSDFLALYASVFGTLCSRKQTEEALRDKTNELQSITEAMTTFLKSGNWQKTTTLLLRSALNQTKSEYGFLGVVVEGPILRILAHEGIVWDNKVNREFYEKAVKTYQERGYLEFTRFENLFGRAIITGEAVISNHPESDPRSSGLPPGHPPLHHFLGVPIYAGTEVVGLIGVANRPGGYTETEQNQIKALTQAASLIYNSYRQQHQIKASLAEKEVMLKEIHHRVKNNLQIISSLLYLQSKQLDDKQTLEIFIESQNRIRSMALIHENLYQSENLARIEFAKYIRHLTKHLFRLYRTSAQAVELKLNIENILLDIDTAIPCGLILNELVSNAFKHAFPTGQAGEIRVDLQSDQKKRLTLTVSDNGVGFPKNLDFRNTDSLGLKLITTLTNQLSGTIELNRSRGTVFKITFSEHKRPVSP